MLALPSGAATILPWADAGETTLHVMIDPIFVNRSKLPKVYQGYKIITEVRSPSVAYR